MKPIVDKEAGALYLCLDDSTVIESEEGAPGNPFLVDPACHRHLVYGRCILRANVNIDDQV